MESFDGARKPSRGGGNEMKPDPATCRWLDRYFGDVCRHPTGEPQGPWFYEPKCQPCRSCGYQPITPRTPAWDDPGNEKEKKK